MFVNPNPDNRGFKATTVTTMTTATVPKAATHLVTESSWLPSPALPLLLSPSPCLVPFERDQTTSANTNNRHGACGNKSY